MDVVLCLMVVGYKISPKYPLIFSGWARIVSEYKVILYMGQQILFIFHLLKGEWSYLPLTIIEL